MLSRLKTFIVGQEWGRGITTAFHRSSAVLIRNPDAGEANERTRVYAPLAYVFALICPFPCADVVLSRWALETGVRGQVMRADAQHAES